MKTGIEGIERMQAPTCATHIDDDVEALVGECTAISGDGMDDDGGIGDGDTLRGIGAGCPDDVTAMNVII